MLRGMTWREFREWHTYESLEPFEEQRADYRAAQIVQALWNIARDAKKNPNGWPLEDFIMRFGDDQRTRPKVEQSLAYQEQLIDAWIIGNNAAFKDAPRGRN